MRIPPSTAPADGPSPTAPSAPPARRRLPGTSRIALRAGAALGAAALAVLLPAAPAYADPPRNLPQNAGGYEQTFSPAYDYDGDGCYATPAIGPDGTLAPGLRTTGAINGNCRDRSDLDNTQTYARSACNNGWCAVVYASYFEKDQAVHGSGLGGHRHDWEHVVVWIDQAANRAEFVSTTQHSTVRTYPRAQVRFDGPHPKVVYHKDGPGTHFFRLANGGDEPPENHYGDWRYPPLVDWNGWPDTALRDRLMSADFGAATIKITDRDDRFRRLLADSRPSIPFDPWS
ncbi:NPP1 family protein [Streptomyces sp. NPDC005805]|uniref:NPP1 family protein n=1 Tax=Streptomyces sp. NPDC005805 TaxID=3157068 RepID=UPI0033F9DF5F